MNIVVNERNIKISQLPGRMIRFKNFEGERWGDGKRDFTIELDEASGRRAEELGWTCISWKNKIWNDPESELIPCMRIKIGNYLPDTYIASGSGSRSEVPFQTLDDNHIDSRSIEWISLYCTASDSDSMGKHYHTAYLSEITVKFEASPFADEFGEETPF